MSRYYHLWYDPWLYQHKSISIMKKLLFLPLAAVLLASCSTCYECSEEVVIYDGNTPVDTTTNTEEFCTADQSEVTAREQNGAECQVN